MKTVKRILLALLVLGFLCFLGGAAVLYGIYNDVAEEAKEKIKGGAIDSVVFSESPVFYDDGETVLGVFFDKTHRRYIEYASIPPYFVKALVATEDKTFFSHHGLDYPGLARAAIEGIIRQQTPRGSPPTPPIRDQFRQAHDSPSSSRHNTYGPLGMAARRARGPDRANAAATAASTVGACSSSSRLTSESRLSSCRPWSFRTRSWAGFNSRMGLVSGRSFWPRARARCCICTLGSLSSITTQQAESARRVEARVTYHDPCYLARYNQVCAPPRELLGYENVQEMPRSGVNSFCCGGGGGQMWMESDPDKRLNLHRLEEALETGAQTVATACPYCMIMFDDAIRSKGLTERIQVKDIAEIVASSIS